MADKKKMLAKNEAQLENPWVEAKPKETSKSKKDDKSSDDDM